jgi:hypothetical protein
VSDRYAESVKLYRDIQSGVDSPSANIGREYVKAHHALSELLDVIRSNRGEYGQEWNEAWKVWSELGDWARRNLGVQMGPSEHGGKDSLCVAL